VAAGFAVAIVAAYGCAPQLAAAADCRLLCVVWLF
jgi:hypothetical protein